MTKSIEENPLTESLAQTFEEVSKLSPQEQDAIAEILLRELDSERRWAESFAKSEELLSELYAEAIEEHRAGKTKPLNVIERCSQRAQLRH